MYKKLISADQLLVLKEKGNCLIFDCRFDLMDAEKGEKHYLESHIPGAIYAHLDHHLSSRITPQTGRHPMPGTQQLVGWLASCGMDETAQVVVYDDAGGAIAARLWWLLKCLGHEAVALLDGGWQGWLAQGLAVDAQIPEPQTSTYSARLNSDCEVTTERVLKNLKTKDFVLIDVRASERFRGVMEPIDPIAGHIPDAWNIPLTENLDEAGYFKPVDELKVLYADLLQDWSPTQQVYMCGSGVTACHSVLAMALISDQMARVYAGSWSEWIRDEQRPVVVEPMK